MNNPNQQSADAKNAMLEKLRALKTITVFVRENGDGDLTPFYSSDPTNPNELAFVMKQLNVQRLTPELRAAFQAQSEEHHETMLVMSATQNAEARKQLEDYRNRKGLEMRPDEDFTALMSKIPLYVQSELLRLSMLEPTLEEVGGIEGIPTIEPVLYAAISSGFKGPKAPPVQKSAEEIEADRALAEVFREHETPDV